MAHFTHTKENKYAQLQSVRDEQNAPVFLESAGDVLIHDLHVKQTKTNTSLEEQLQINQEFSTGELLQPTKLSGFSSLKDFRTKVAGEHVSQSSTSDDDVTDIRRLQEKTGLSRHLLEAELAAKPNSVASKLYEFALKNRRSETKKLDARDPINYLKEIEEEYFGHLKTDSSEKEVSKKRKRKKRRRKKTNKVQIIAGGSSTVPEVEEDSDSADSSEIEEEGEVTRPSLWDVKDMRQFCQPKVFSCSKPAMYTIKDGKILKLDTEDLTNTISDDKND